MSTWRIFSWIAASVAAILLLTQPVSVQTQLAVSLTIIAALLVVWKFTRGAASRQVFLALASFVVIRYVYWRVTYTLPPFSDPLGLLFGSILLAAELYWVALLAVSLVVNADPMRRRPTRDLADDDLPAVDVLIPTYNEDEYILATTIAAAKSMDYPAHKLRVYLLDDGGTDQKCDADNPIAAESARVRRAALRSLCASLGAVYLTRAKNEHAKAGNMNNALPHLTGELVAVLDADHAPFRSFLRETVGYFRDDPKLFLVQTPHIFINPDPIERNLQTFDRMPSENEMFYSMTQLGLDKWDASYFCGSAALLRRAALQEAGGFSGVTITEDCETAFELHARGWSSVFVDKPLVAGLQPETFACFIRQRVRWCQGMLQILMLKTPLLKRGLAPIQRLGYLSSMAFWFFPLPRLVFMLAPLFYILFDIKIFVANVDEAIAYTATYIVVNVMLQNYLFGAVRWPWVSELYEYCQGVFLSKAIASVIANPRKPEFEVTTKGLAVDRDRLSELAWPFFAIYGLLLMGAAVAVYRYFAEPGVADLMLLVGLWNYFNLVTAGVALGAVAERKQTDRYPRLAIDRRGVLRFDDQNIEVEISSVSVGGCRLRARDASRLPKARGATARLFIEPVGNLAEGRSLPVVVEHPLNDEGSCSCAFGEMEPEDYLVLADLMYGDARAMATFLAARRRHKSLVVGTLQFTWWGFSEPFRAFAYLLKRRSAAALPEPAPTPRASTMWLRRLLARTNERRRLEERERKKAA